MQTGLYPNPKDLSASQEGYVEEREKGYYNPLVGGIPMIESVQSKNDRELQEEQIDQQQKQVTKTDETVNKTQQSPGRPSGTNQIPLQAAEEYGRDNVQEVIYKIQDLESYALENFKKHKKLKSIDDSQKQLIGQLCESIVCSKEKNQWKRTMLSCIKNTNKIAELSTINDILDISAKNELTQYPSAILYHSQKQQN
jgi:hypothetical protein